ncbi:hypothetical protein, partial [Salmonella enterica]|uniref:hypothetical protein n=1 Tax=Salmonella enterica TaxID=28901 RepID=UPI0019D56833
MSRRTTRVISPHIVAAGRGVGRRGSRHEIATVGLLSRWYNCTTKAAKDFIPHVDPINEPKGAREDKEEKGKREA